MNAKWTATKWLHAIQSREITCIQVLEFFEGRYEQHNSAINAVIATDFDAARERAQAADAALDRGEIWGPLHGLPMTIKDSFEYIGMPTTSGAPELASHVARQNADVVQRVLDAGAIVFGKTNLPLYALDFQSYNAVNGTTNNPYDLTRTPGGSSGGAASALAAGLTPLEIGSDLAGSIRLPAHFCGVYGHKPTIGIIPLRGHIPGPPGTLAEGDLAVAGPMANSAEDLALAMDNMVGARSYDAVGVKITLPKPRKVHLNEYRVAAWLDDPSGTIDADLATQYHRIVDELRSAGVYVTKLSPLGKRLDEFVALYTRMLGAAVGAGLPDQQYQAMRLLRAVMPITKRFLGLSQVAQGYITGMTQRYKDYAPLPEQRENLRFSLREFFDEYDILLAPVAMTQAFEHIHDGDVISRKLNVNGKQVGYSDVLKWNAFATLIGLPSTSTPIGLVNGLPANIQVIGGAYRDYETIAFAQHLVQITGPPPRPPQFVAD